MMLPELNWGRWNARMERVVRSGVRTDEQLELRQRLMSSFRAYFEWVWPALMHGAPIPFVSGYWVDAQCELAQHLALHGGRGIINLPPGCGKSLVWSAALPVWKWLHDPSTSILSFAHNATLSAHLAGKSKLIITDERHLGLFGDLVSIDPMKDGANQWKIRSGGGRVCLSRGGSTGWRGAMCLLDDIETPEQVESPAESATTWETIRDQILQRVDDTDTRPGIYIAVQQRLGVNDSTAKLKEHWGSNCHHLVLELDRTERIWSLPPMVPPDPRLPGECLLPPSVYGSAKLDDLRALPRTYETQAQQSPTDSSSETRKLQAWSTDRVQPFPGGASWQFGLSVDYGDGAGRNVTVLRAWDGRHVWILRAVASRSGTTTEQDADDVRIHLLEPMGLMPGDLRDNVGDVNVEFKLDGLTMNDRFGRALGTHFRTAHKGRVGQEVTDIDLAYAKGLLFVAPDATIVIEANNLWQGDKSIHKNVVDAYRYGVHDEVVRLLSGASGARIGVPTVKKRGI